MTIFCPLLRQATIVLPDDPGNYTVRVFVAAQLDSPVLGYHQLLVPIGVIGASGLFCVLSPSCGCNARTHKHARAHASLNGVLRNQRADL